jgi:hypothetical protein
VAVGAFADPGRRGRRLPAPSGKRARPLQVTTPTDGFQGEARERESSVLVVDLTVELPPGGGQAGPPPVASGSVLQPCGTGQRTKTQLPSAKSAEGFQRSVVRMPPTHPFHTAFHI